jgi:hypothetical protein
MIRKANNNVCGLLSRTRVVDAQRPSHASKIRLSPEPNATDPIAKPPLIGTMLHKIVFEEMQCRNWPPRFLYGLSSQICLAGRIQRLISNVASDSTSATATTHLHAKEGKDESLGRASQCSEICSKLRVSSRLQREAHACTRPPPYNHDPVERI